MIRDKLCSRYRYTKYDKCTIYSYLPLVKPLESVVCKCVIPPTHLTLIFTVELVASSPGYLKSDVNVILFHYKIPAKYSFRSIV